MRAAPAAAIIVAMESPRPLKPAPARVVIDLAGDHPVSGVLHSGGLSRDFEGWIELLALLERAFGGGLLSAPPRSSPAPGDTDQPRA
jgi:hypothetical protein